MNIYCTTDKENYEVDIPLGVGEYHSVCPVCSHNRKKHNQRVKCFSFNGSKGVGVCHHCEARFVLAKEYNTTISLPKIAPINKRQVIQEEPICSISWNYIDRYIGNPNRLESYLFSKHGANPDYIERIKKVVNDYRLCSTLSGETIFLQIDKENRLRSGQIIPYDESTGKRVKENSSKAVDWLHNQDGIKENLEANWRLTQCYFGEHLINDNQKEIVIVESPKTAIICSIYLPKYIWLATMGKNGLNAKKSIVLKGRCVILIPDLNAYEEWEKKSKEIEQEIGVKMKLNPFIQQQATEEEKEHGLDIADFIIKKLDF